MFFVSPNSHKERPRAHANCRTGRVETCASPPWQRVHRLLRTHGVQPRYEFLVAVSYSCKWQWVVLWQLPKSFERHDEAKRRVLHTWQKRRVNETHWLD